MLRMIEDRSGDAKRLSTDLNELAREGARRMLVAALEAEVTGHVERHRAERDERGHAQVVRNGRVRTRRVTVGSCTVQVSALRVNDRQVYRPRHPERTVPYRALAHHFERFLLLYEERFQPTHGYLRPCVEPAVHRYLDCGSFDQGQSR